MAVDTAGPVDELAVVGAPEVAFTKKRSRAVFQYRLIGYVVVLGVWQLLSTFVVAQNILPGPWLLANEIWEIARGGTMWYHFSATMRTLFISLAIVFVIGTAVGVSMGLSRWWEAFFKDSINVLLGIPGLIFVLIVVLVLGLNPIGPIVAVVICTYAYVTVQIWEGVKALPKDLLDMAQAFGVPFRRRLRQIIIPAVAPYMFTALTYGFALAWKLTMLTELFGAARGVGFMMRLEFAYFSMPGLFAWAGAFFILALFIERAIFQSLSRRFFRWRVVSFQG